MVEKDNEKLGKEEIKGKEKQSIKPIKVKEKVQKSEGKKEDTVKNHLGEIKIAPEVLATIVNRTVLNTSGVAGLVSHSKSSFGTLLGVKEMEEGIKIELSDEKSMSAYISVIIEYGFVIIDVAKEIQTIVKSEIENKTGLMVKKVDVNIMAIQMTKKNTKTIQPIK